MRMCLLGLVPIGKGIRLAGFSNLPMRITGERQGLNPVKLLKVLLRGLVMSHNLILIETRLYIIARIFRGPVLCATGDMRELVGLIWKFNNQKMGSL